MAVNLTFARMSTKPPPTLPYLPVLYIYADVKIPMLRTLAGLSCALGAPYILQSGSYFRLLSQNIGMGQWWTDWHMPLNTGLKPLGLFWIPHLPASLRWILFQEVPRSFMQRNHWQVYHRCSQTQKLFSVIECNQFRLPSLEMDERMNNECIIVNK